MTMLMADVDLHIVGVFSASLLGLCFVLLFSVFRHGRAKTKRNARSYPGVVGSEFNRSSDCCGTDVIIVGAGVAGAALAHTLAMVTLPLLTSFFSCLVSFLFLVV